MATLLWFRTPVSSVYPTINAVKREWSCGLRPYHVAMKWRDLTCLGGTAHIFPTVCSMHVILYAAQLSLKIKCRSLYCEQKTNVVYFTIATFFHITCSIVLLAGGRFIFAWHAAKSCLFHTSCTHVCVMLSFPSFTE